jgi:hypothetical protein
MRFQNSVFSMMILICGCATTTPTPDLRAAAKKATDAAAVAHAVEFDVLEARLLDLVDRESLAPSPKVPAALVCRPSPSVELTAKELGVYADAITAVGKVADKPKDATYAGYLAQFKKDREAIEAASKTPEEASEKDAKETSEAQARCISALSTDVDKHLLGPPPAGAAFALTALPAAVADINGMILSLVGLAEQAERQVAVHKAAEHMMVSLRDATRLLSEPPGDSDYVLPGEASSRLENTLAIHRWLVAQRLQDDWQALHRAREQRNSTSMFQSADQFAANASVYVQLSATDPQKLLKALQKAVDDAGKIDDKTSIDEIFTSLGNIGAALSSVDDKYKAFRKTID